MGNRAMIGVQTSDTTALFSYVHWMEMDSPAVLLAMSQDEVEQFVRLGDRSGFADAVPYSDNTGPHEYQLPILKYESYATTFYLYSGGAWWVANNWSLPDSMVTPFEPLTVVSVNQEQSHEDQ